MGRLNGFSGREVRRVAERQGWVFERWSGDHMVFSKRGSFRNLSIPNHREVAEGTLRTLIREMGTTVNEFLALAGK